MAMPMRERTATAELPMECLRDPFAWREALTPTGPSPANSARGSRQVTPSASARGSRAVTPVATPPRSPIITPASASDDLVATMRSKRGLSGSPVHADLSARSYHSQQELSAREMASARSSLSVGHSAYRTPNSTGRISDFASVYEGPSSARVVDSDTMYDERPSVSGNGWGYPVAGDVRRGSVRSSTYASALSEFCPPTGKGSSSSSGTGVGSVAASSSGYPSASRGSARLAVPVARGVPPSSSPTASLVHESSDRVASASKVALDVKSVFSMARHGKHQDVEASLKAGFDPGSVDNFGNTLFHVASQNGNKRIAKLAAKYGADMDAINGKGNTGLHFLFAYGYPDVADYFISKGADANLRNESGKAPREGIR